MIADNRGFTLVEIICALALIGIITVSFFPIMNTSLKNISSLKNKNEMSYIGEMVVEKLKSPSDEAKSTLNSLDTNGVVDYVDDDFDSQKYNCKLIKLNSSDKLIEFNVKIELKGLEDGFNVEYRASIPKKE